MSETNLDFSVRNVPDSWHDAAQDAPQPDKNSGRDVRRSGGRVATGAKPDLVTGGLAGLAMTIVSGAAWYVNEVNNKFTGTLAAIAFAVVLGGLIAVAVRIGAGPAGPEMRVGVGAALYLVGLFGMTYFVAREQFSTLNRRAPSFSEAESLVTDLYLSNFGIVFGWVLGFAVLGYTTFALRHRRR